MLTAVNLLLPTSVVKSLDSEARVSGLKFWLCHLQAMWAWKSYLTSLCFYSPISKM